MTHTQATPAPRRRVSSGAPRALERPTGRMLAPSTRRAPTGDVESPPIGPQIIRHEWVHRGSTDVVLLLVVGALVLIGLLAVYSGSALNSFFASASQNDLTYVTRQASGVVAGLLLMIFTSRFDYGHYRTRFIYVLLAAAYVLLAMTWIPALSTEVNGARRWISLFGFRFQPAEYAKIVTVMYLAYSISKKGETMTRFLDSFAFHGLVFGLMVLFLMRQPDLGSSVVICTMVAIMLFVGGARASFLMGFVGLGIVSVYAAIQSASYRMDRVTAWIDPWADPAESGYQLVNSYVALANGGLTGTGFGQGRGRLGYVPELYNDFVGALIGEEFGLVGIAFVAFLFVLFFWRGVLIAYRARDRFGFLLALGITTLITLQAVINLGVVTGMLPTKGLTLPFVSYGRSSLVLLLGAVGILLNIGQRNPDLRTERKQAKEESERELTARMKRHRVMERRRTRALKRVGHTDV